MYTTSGNRWGFFIYNNPLQPHVPLQFGAWTVEDLRHVVKSFLASPTYTQVKKADRLKMSLFERESPKRPLQALWPQPSQSEWSQTAWTNLLQTLPSTWGSEDLVMVLSQPAPLRGLLDCLHHVHRTDRNQVTVLHGTATLEDLDTFVQTHHQTGSFIHFENTNIVVPSGEGHFLRVRRDRLLKSNNNIHIFTPKWRTQTGEEYVWADGWTWL